MHFFISTSFFIQMEASLLPSQKKKIANFREDWKKDMIYPMLGMTYGLRLTIHIKHMFVKTFLRMYSQVCAEYMYVHLITYTLCNYLYTSRLISIIIIKLDIDSEQSDNENIVCSGLFKHVGATDKNTRKGIILI